jgi:hypothetical protein
VKRTCRGRLAVSICDAKRTSELPSIFARLRCQGNRPAALSRPPRVRNAQQVFPSFERRDPTRACPLTYGPFLQAHGTPELAVCIRLRRASKIPPRPSPRKGYRANAKLL